MKQAIEATRAAYGLPGYKDIHEGGSRFVGNHTALSDYDFIVHVEPVQYMAMANVYADAAEILGNLGWRGCSDYKDMPLTKRAVWEKTIEGEKVNLIVVFDTAEYNQMLAAVRICKWLHKEANLSVDKEWRAKIHEAARGNFLALNKGAQIIDSYGY